MFSKIPISCPLVSNPYVKINAEFKFLANTLLAQN